MKLTSAVAAFAILTSPALGQELETSKALSTLSGPAVQAGKESCKAAEFLSATILNKVLVGIEAIGKASKAAPPFPRFKNNGWKSKSIKAAEAAVIIDYVRFNPIENHGQNNQTTIASNGSVSASGHYNHFPQNLLRSPDDIQPHVLDRYQNVKTYSGEVTPRASLGFGENNRNITLQKGETRISQSCYPGRESVSTQLSIPDYNFSFEGSFANPIFCHLAVPETVKSDIAAILDSLKIGLPKDCKIGSLDEGASQ